MRCQEVRSLIKGYHSDSLDEFTRIKIHHHLAQCSSCTEDYEMWVRGEDYIQKPESPHGWKKQSSTASFVAKNVMSRIQQEEKWANPQTYQTSYTKRTKTLLSFVFSMALIACVLVFITVVIPQPEPLADPVVHLDMLEENWSINQIVLREREFQDETTMNFQVVASLSDPIIYTIPTESTNIPFTVVASIFGILIVILGMSWITRA